MTKIVPKKKTVPRTEWWTGKNERTFLIQKTAGQVLHFNSKFKENKKRKNIHSCLKNTTST